MFVVMFTVSLELCLLVHTVLISRCVLLHYLIGFIDLIDLLQTAITVHVHSVRLAAHSVIDIMAYEAALMVVEC